MGLAASQVRFLTLTVRKGNLEENLAVESLRKQSLTREMSELSREYYSRLQGKNISFYANNQFNKINYTYLMGPGKNTSLIDNNSPLIKDNPSMILTDYRGQVVLSDTYADAITSVLGNSIMDSNGAGGTFSTDKIAEILSHIIAVSNKEDIQTIIDGGLVYTSAEGTVYNTLSGNQTGSTTMDTTNKTTDKYRQLVSFYYPIFLAAANNGWTTEYNQQMSYNDNYISDALVSGTFQLANVNEDGSYDEGCSLNYFITAGLIESNTSSNIREELTAWFKAEESRITEKETIADTTISDISAELEAVKTEMQSIKTLIDDAISSVFNWGSG